MKPIIIKSIILIFTISISVSCQTKKDIENGVADNIENEDKLSKIQSTAFPAVNEEFSSYLENFKKTDLPIYIKGCRERTKGLIEFDGIRFKQFNEDYSYSYRQIPTNGKFVATITLGVADCYLPVLTTYKLNGKIIDRKTIAIGYCGSDCGYSCEEFMTITNDFKLYTSDTVSTYECDSLGLEIPGTYEHYVIYKEGKLLTDGKIQLTDEIKKPLEARKNTP
jgi:hypothetical protein